MVKMCSYLTFVDIVIKDNEAYDIITADKERRTSMPTPDSSTIAFQC